MSMPCPVPKAIASRGRGQRRGRQVVVEHLDGLSLARLRPDVERLAHQAHQRLEALVALAAGQASMMAIVALSAPEVPPETGASTNSMPAAASSGGARPPPP